MQAVHILCPAGRRGSWQAGTMSGLDNRVHILCPAGRRGSSPTWTKTTLRLNVHILCPAGRRGSPLSQRTHPVGVDVHILCPAGRRGSNIMADILPGLLGSYPVPSRTAWKRVFAAFSGRPARKFISCAQQDGVEALSPRPAHGSCITFISCAQQDGVEGDDPLDRGAATRVHILCPAGRRGSRRP